MSEKLNQQLEQQDLEAMADQLLAEDAAKREEEDSKSRKKLDDKTIAALPAATLITANEKLKDLLAKGCKTGKLDPGELSDVVDTMDLDGDQMDRIYDSLADLGIEGFWNFSHYDLSVPYPDVVVENVHLGDSLMSLGYRLRNQD